MLHYFAISKGGMVREDFDITLQDPTMQHDFAMTEDYVIFLDFPLIGDRQVRPAYMPASVKSLFGPELHQLVWRVREY